MKKISYKYLCFALILSLSIVACNDFEDENYDFSNTASPYVELNASSYSGEPEEELSIGFRLRVAVQKEVNVGYEITGDISQSGSVTIEPGEVLAPLVVTLPGPPDTIGTANVAITSVDDGFTIGRAAGGDNVEASISWEPE